MKKNGDMVDTVQYSEALSDNKYFWDEVVLLWDKKLR